MRIRTQLLGFVAALVLMPAAASAAGMAGTVSLDYENMDFYGGGFSANSWGGAAAGVVNLGGAWNIEADGSYHHASASGLDANAWNLSGSVFWQDNKGRIGVQVGYNTGEGVGPSVHGFNYGLAGEWFALPNLSIAVKGGGLTGSSGVSGYYAGLQGRAYIIPNLMLSAAIDYTRFSAFHETDYKLEAEYLVSQSTPVSVFAGYSNSDFEGAGTDVDIWMIGIRLYCNDPAGGTLVDRQRSGTLGWAGSISPVALRF